MEVWVMIEGQEGVTWPDWLAIADAAESSALHGLFRSDHYQSITRGEPAGALDAWATLAGLAAITRRLRLGTMVSPVTFRPAAVLAKNVVTVDHISGGRVELGIGAGWHEAEHVAYRLAFPSLRERMDELERQLAEITRQWTLADDIYPKPYQQPHPPIIVGGRGRPRTVAAAIRFASEYNLLAASPDEAASHARLLGDAASAARRRPLRLSVTLPCLVGNNAQEVRRRVDRRRTLLGRATTSAVLSGTVGEVAQQLVAYRDAGVQRAVLQHLDHADVEMIPLLGALAQSLAT